MWSDGSLTAIAHSHHSKHAILYESQLNTKTILHEGFENQNSAGDNTARLKVTTIQEFTLQCRQLGCMVIVLEL